MNVRGTVICGLLLALAGCANGVQTSSGASFLAARPEFRPAPGPSIERAVYDAANTEPLLQFPGRFGLARIARGQLTAVPPAEADKWLALVKDAGPAYGSFVPISPLVAEMTAQATGATAANAIDKIRIGAARQHVDAVLIYEVTTNSQDRASPLSLLDLTIIGAYLVPSRGIEGQATANAMLIDVRNGYPYGTATSTASQNGFVASVGSNAKASDLVQEASVEAVGKLAADVGQMFTKLKSELGMREL